MQFQKMLNDERFCLLTSCHFILLLTVMYSRPDLIDPALLRPGRLDKSLYVGMPNESDRLKVNVWKLLLADIFVYLVQCLINYFANACLFQILKALSRKMNLSDTVNLSEIATLSSNYSGADLQALLYNAHLLSIHSIIGFLQNTCTVIFVFIAVHLPVKAFS